MLSPADATAAAPWLPRLGGLPPAATLYTRKSAIAALRPSRQPMKMGEKPCCTARYA